MSNEQKLREALQAYQDANEMSPYGDYSKIEWESSAGPVNPSWGGGDCKKHGRWYGRCYSCSDEWDNLRKRADRDAYTARENALNAAKQLARQALATTEPAVNQQLTTDPFDERAARATLPTQRSSMDGLPKPFGYVSDGFADGLRFQHNPWPVEHTLLHSTLPVFSAAAVQQFKEDAKRYRWLADSNNYYEAINLISDGSLTEDALGKAIDAAMAKGVKG